MTNITLRYSPKHRSIDINTTKKIKITYKQNPYVMVKSSYVIILHIVCR